ncbi:hypothetical protein LCGC14_0712510, partial [marine sediment metagenome]
NSDVIVLGGVGNFKTAVKRLKTLNLWDTINEEVLDNKKPVLGICLGMQLFADVSYEDGKTEGFGWIEGEVEKIPNKDVRVPHIGWNIVKPVDVSLFTGMLYSYFYYMHSYHFVPDDKSVVIAYTPYGNLNIVASVRKDNIIGVQFHPEKSQRDGLRLFKNILEDIR